MTLHGHGVPTRGLHLRARTAHTGAHAQGRGAPAHASQQQHTRAFDGQCVPRRERREGRGQVCARTRPRPFSTAPFPIPTLPHTPQPAACPARPPARPPPHPYPSPTQSPSWRSQLPTPRAMLSQHAAANPSSTHPAQCTPVSRDRPCRTPHDAPPAPSPAHPSLTQIPTRRPHPARCIACTLPRTPQYNKEPFPALAGARTPRDAQPARHCHP